MPIEVGFQELKEFLRDQIAESYAFQEKQRRVLTADRKTILKGLEEARDEVEDKHREALRLWKRNVAQYNRFLRAAPGSQQIRTPGAMPTKPALLEEVKALIRTFQSLQQDALTIDLPTLQGYFTLTGRAVHEARAIRDTVAINVSGGVALSTFTTAGGTYR